MNKNQEAARVLMHLIQTGRKAQWKQDDHLEHPEGWPYFYGKTPDDTETQAFEAADIIDRLARNGGAQTGSARGRRSTPAWPVDREGRTGS